MEDLSTHSHKRALHISIDLAALKANLEVARTLAGGQKLFAVVKADAYGHGAVRVAQALDRADGFAVVTLQEALELRAASITQPILVLQGARAQSECEAFIKHALWPVIHCQEQLVWFENLLDKNELQAWLKLDTGMGRLGFQPEQARAVLANNSGLKWAGVMTHFASADEPERVQTQQQIELFHALTKGLSLPKSLANSAGVIAWPSSRADWARPGIMLYGSNPIAGTEHGEPALQAVMRVSAPLISIKDYKAGDSIGYAAGYVCSGAMSVGYVGIGYGDGLPRVLNNSASVYCNGKMCSVLGRVSMDSIAIDLSLVSEVQMGDEVVLWGPEHPVDILANAANTISYELMTSIRGPRDYI